MGGTQPYKAVDGVINLLYSLKNGAKVGTGITLFKETGMNLLGSTLPPVLVDRSIGNLNNLFGGYPEMSDFAPSLVFAVLFMLIAVLHLGLFLTNFARGHYFYISFVWFLIASLKGIGFALRTQWSKNILQVGMGLTSEVFLITGGVFLISVNLVLAQRLFTWRHPVGGDRNLFKNIMYVLYAIVALVIALTVTASFVPYLYYLSEHAFWAYGVCVMFSSILIILYSLTAILLLLLSYFFKPTRKDENLYTYQPWWIESFHPLYFVRPGAAQEAEESFMKRNHNHRHAVRVIAATHHHYNMVEGLTNERGTLEHNKSIIIVSITTLFTLVQSVMRCYVTFQLQPSHNNNPIAKPIVAYVCWGVLEVIVHIVYLVGRVDLRFYKPDVLPAKVRSIITAKQSFFASRNISRNISDAEDESELSDFDDFDYTELSGTGSKPPPNYKQKEKFDESSNDNESDFNF